MSDAVLSIQFVIDGDYAPEKVVGEAVEIALHGASSENYVKRLRVGHRYRLYIEDITPQSDAEMVEQSADRFKKGYTNDQG